MVEMKICPTCGTEYEPKERFCPRDGSALRAQAGSADLVGQVVADRYHVLRKLGEGGMGQVYLAEHVKMGRKSALKVMHPSMGSDPDAISRFNREASNASRINHPHVASIYDFGETPEGLIYLAMEYVEGKPLADLIDQQGAIPVQRVSGIIAQTADALQAAHDLGIVHRDLKPDNIMLARNRDGSDCVKVVDFGIAKAGAEGNQKVTRTGLVVGTPEYMSPEQLAGDKLDGRSDVYSLGLVAFFLLTGTLPFPSDSAQESMIMRLTDRPKALGEMRPEVPWHPELQLVMDKVLARPVAERYQSAPEFARELVRAIAKMPETAFRKDGTLLMGAIDPRTVPGTIAAGGGTVRPSAPTVAAPRPPAPAPTPAPAPAAERSRTPLLVGMGVLALALLGGGAALLGRRGADATPATVAPSAGALPGATGTTVAATSTPTESFSKPSVGTATTTASEPAATGATTTADAGAADEADVAPLHVPIDEYTQRITADNAPRYLATSDRVLARRLVRPKVRLYASVVKATALSNLGRSGEACAILRDVRRDYSIMDANFRTQVDILLDPQSGACQ